MLIDACNPMTRPMLRRQACCAVGIVVGLEPKRLSNQCYFREEKNLGFGYLAAKIVFPLIALVAAALVAAQRAGSGDLWGAGADPDYNGDSSANTSAADDNDRSAESDPLLRPDRVRHDTDTSLQPLQDSSEQAEAGGTGRHTRSRLISTATAADFVLVSDFAGPRPNRLGPVEFKHSVYLVYEVLALILAVLHAALSFGKNCPYEMEWVDVFLNASRGVVLFLCFGTDDRLWNTIALFFQPAIQAVRGLVFQTETSDLQRCREWQLLSTDSAVSRYGNYGNFDLSFGAYLTSFGSSPLPAMLSAHARWMLIGACDPMTWAWIPVSPTPRLPVFPLRSDVMPRFASSGRSATAASRCSSRTGPALSRP